MRTIASNVVPALGAVDAASQLAESRVAKLIARCVEHYGHQALMEVDADSVDASTDGRTLDDQLASATAKESLFNAMRRTPQAQVDHGLFPDGMVGWEELTLTTQAQLRAYQGRYA